MVGHFLSLWWNEHFGKNNNVLDTLPQYPADFCAICTQGIHTFVWLCEMDFCSFWLSFEWGLDQAMYYFELIKIPSWFRIQTKRDLCFCCGDAGILGRVEPLDSIPLWVKVLTKPQDECWAVCFNWNIWHSEVLHSSSECQMFQSGQTAQHSSWVLVRLGRIQRKPLFSKNFCHNWNIWHPEVLYRNNQRGQQRSQNLENGKSSSAQNMVRPLLWCQENREQWSKKVLLFKWNYQWLVSCGYTTVHSA